MRHDSWRKVGSSNKDVLDDGRDVEWNSGGDQSRPRQESV